MKKFLSLLLAMAAAASLAACGQADGQQAPSPPPAESSTSAAEPAPQQPEAQAPAGEGADGAVLVAYFSWADNAVLAEDVDAVASPSVVPPGNVQQLAEWVREETGGELFSIRVTDPYPSDWDACLERANGERGEGARPELVETVENLDQYGTVFLGYPNWWYGVPMALLSFLEQNDLSGKEVYLFCSHGTGGLANSVELIAEAAPGADISDSIFDCYEEEAASSQEAVKAWVSSLGYSRPAETEAGDQAAEQRRVSVEFGDGAVLFDLNDSSAADSLWGMLPLTVQVEDYSTNEKIFYPEQELDTSDAPLAEGEAGTLAYYQPWGDVVFFYGGYSPNPSLFELGQAVEGAGLIGEMSGTITIEAVEP